MPELHARLAALEAQGLRRRLAPPQGIDLSSNDVLGLSRHPAVRDALIEALQAGVAHGGGASRLLTGEDPVWGPLEARVAAWQGAEAAVFVPTGFAANTGLIAALPEAGDLLVSDALNHASLVDGARLSRAERVIVPHGDVDAIDAALGRSPGRRAWVVVESVYSMDGDSPDLPALAEVCARRGAHLLVDEAHATGLYGPGGQGRVVELGLRPRVLTTVHTCGKALGLSGAFVVGTRDLVDWYVNRARPFVYTTAPPPFLAAGLHAVLDLIQGDAALRARPGQLADRLRARLGLPTPGSHVVPLAAGTPERALRLQARLAERGWDARAIRPPTVPEGTSRVRLVIGAALTEAQIDRLADDVAEVWP